MNRNFFKYFLESDQGTKKNGDTSDVYFPSQSSYVLKDLEKFYIGMTMMNIPKSFDVINKNNNTLYLLSNYGPMVTTSSQNRVYSLTISDGDYDIDEFVTELNSILSTMQGTSSCSFDYDTYKLTFNFTYPTGIIISGTTCLRELGFNDQVTTSVVTTLDNPNKIYTIIPYSTSSTSNNITTYSFISNIIVDLSYTRSIYIISDDLNTNSYDSRKQTTVSNILAVIPNIAITNGYNYQYYNNQTPEYVPLANKTITGISIRLEDDRGNVLEMNGLNWMIGFNIIIR